MLKELAIKDLRIDGGTQQRPVDDDVVVEYKYKMAEGEEFPAIDVMFDGHAYWVYDGFHRLHATRKNGKQVIKANVTDGTQRDAIYQSFAANKSHGLARQPGTVKRMLLEKILPDEEWSKTTDEKMARHIGCSRRTLIRARQSIKESADTGQVDSSIVTSHNPSTEESTMDSKAEKAGLGAKPVKIKDSVGQEVPANLAEIFSRTSEIRAYNKLVSDVFRHIKEAVEANDPLYANCKLEQLQSHLKNFRSTLRFAIPYAVCPYCGGDVNNAECRACNSNGFLGELQYQAVPSEMKE